MNFNTLGGRRFVLAAMSGFLAFLLQWFGKLDVQGMAYGLVIGSTVGAFITGVVMEKKHAGERDEPKP